MFAEILIVEDNDLERELYANVLSSEGYAVSTVSSLQQARNILQHQLLHIIILDIRLPDGNGLDFLEEIKAINREIAFILFTSSGSIVDGVRAIKAGAFDYLIKGDAPEKMINTVNLAAKSVTERLMAKLQKNEDEKIGFSAIIGDSAAINKCKAMAQKVAATNANVLLLGETGVGKDLFAEAIHSESSRRNKPFLAINCSAISGEILESELFGYKAGAFTGAVKDKKGLFEMAHQGTIFLDEIGEMAIQLQARILRVLQNKSFIKLGDTKTTEVDCRIIAATNIDINAAIRKGSFREDLFYRISSFTIRIPPLRERGDDVKLIAAHLVRTIPKRIGMTVPQLSPTFIETLASQSWKGNVRELINVIERSVIISEGVLDESLLDFQIVPKNAIEGSLDDLEREHIKAILLTCNGNKRATARKLGIAIATLYRKLELYGL